MATESGFHLDCHGVIGECGFACARCVDEIQSVVGRMPGVDKAYLDETGEEAKIVIEHDPDLVTVDQLTDVLARLPSFYEGCFVPRLAES